MASIKPCVKNQDEGTWMELVKSLNEYKTKDQIVFFFKRKKKTCSAVMIQILERECVTSL